MGGIIKQSSGNTVAAISTVSYRHFHILFS